MSLFAGNQIKVNTLVELRVSIMHLRQIGTDVYRIQSFF